MSVASGEGDRSPGPDGTAWLLAGLGLVPFVILSGGAAILGAEHPAQALLVDMLRAWGAVILAFLGGIRWGLALVAPSRSAGAMVGPSRSALTLAGSIIPAALGFAALLVPPVTGLGLLLLGFGAQGAWDSITLRGGVVPAWFVTLRVAITLVVAACLMLAILRL